MIRFVRTFSGAVMCAALSLTTLLATPAFADTDYSDIWWAGLAENGWGVNFAQNDNAIFVTFFTYDSSNKPTWFGGTIYRVTDGHYTGPLYTIVGDYFAHLPYNPGVFEATLAGTMDFTATDVSHAIFNFTVNGVAVNKNIMRQTLVNVAVAGNYFGAVVQGLSADCNNDGNASTDYVPTQIIVTQSASPGTVQIQLKDTVSPFDVLCTITGVATQTGRVFDIPTATYSCGGMPFTGLHVFDIRRTANNGIEGRWKTLPGDTCVETSRFVGAIQ